MWRELRRLLPHESLVFLGDGKNCPYGARPREEIAALAEQAVRRLLQADCKLVVVACNTATAAAIDRLRALFPEIPIVGMEPAVKPACLHTKSGVVGVLATERSLDGDLFRRTAARYGSRIEVLAVPGEGFVELVESDREQTPEAEACVRRAVEGMLARGPTRSCWAVRTILFCCPSCNGSWPAVVSRSSIRRLPWRVARASCSTGSACGLRRTTGPSTISSPSPTRPIAGGWRPKRSDRFERPETAGAAFDPDTASGPAFQSAFHLPVSVPELFPGSVSAAISEM